MKKTIAFVAVCLLNSTPLKAEGDSLSQSGLFVGAQAGYNYLGTKMDTTSNSIGFNYYSESNKKSKRAHSFTGGVLIGYLREINQRFFAGVDLEGNFDTIDLKQKFSQNLQDFEYKACRQFNLLPSFIIGAQLGERFKFFLKLGFALSSFEYSVKNNTDNIKITRRLFEVGLAPSLVNEFKINQNFAVLATATYEFYKKSKVTFLGTIAPARPTDNNILKMQPNNFSLKFGIKYYI
tara:strand:- start:224 stop:931 length:708 start_codon:yes stop_codon:yes gene_type:complete